MVYAALGPPHIKTNKCHSHSMNEAKDKPMVKLTPEKVQKK